MGQKVSKREQAVNDELRERRQGTYGKVQCEGCREPNLVPDGPGAYDGLCGTHRHQAMYSPHAGEQ